MTPCLLCLNKILILTVGLRVPVMSDLPKLGQYAARTLSVLVMTAVSVLSAGVAVEALRAQEKLTIHGFTVALFAFLGFVAINMVILFGTGEVTFGKPKEPSPIAASSSLIARRIATAEVCSRRTARIVVLLDFLIVAYVIIFRHADAASSQRPTQGASNALALLCCMTLGVGICFLAIEAISFRTNLLERISSLDSHLSDMPPELSTWQHKEVVNYRRQVRNVATGFVKLARRIERQDPRQPSATVYGLVAERLLLSLRSRASLSTVICHDDRALMLDAGAMLIGGCQPALLESLADRTNAFDADGQPIMSSVVGKGRGARVARALTTKTEDLERLFGIAMKVVVLIFVLVLFGVGRLTIEGLLENLKS